jgi:hypothetical protein
VLDIRGRFLSTDGDDYKEVNMGTTRRGGWHPPIYYTVRTVVRAVFWSGMALAALLMATWIVDQAYADDRPACPVEVNKDFTWRRTGDPFVLAECRQPQGIVLERDGTWRWRDPELDGEG